MKITYCTLSIILIAVIHFSFAPIEKEINFAPFGAIQNDTVKKELLSVYNNIQTNNSIKNSNLIKYEKVRDSKAGIRFHHKGYSWWYSISFNAAIRYVESNEKRYIGIENGRSILKEIRFYHEKYMLSFDSSSLVKINEAIFNNSREKESNILVQPFMSVDKKRQYLAIKILGNAHNNVILLCISAKDPFYTTIATK